MRMLHAFTRKFRTLKVIFPKIRRQQALAVDGAKKDGMIDSKDVVDLDSILPIRISVLADSSPLDVAKGQLCGVLGVRFILFQITNFSSRPLFSV